MKMIRILKHSDSLVFENFFRYYFISALIFVFLKLKFHSYVLNYYS